MASTAKHTICVTGGGGFVGRLLTAHLASRARDIDGGVEVVAFDHRADGGESLDIVDQSAVSEAIRRVRPTAVIHLAAIAAPAEARRSPRQAWDVNLTGSMNVAEAVLLHAPEARFSTSGSSEAYGASFIGAAGPLTEEAPLRPLSVYGATKAAADLMIGQMARDGLRAIRFRPFNHAGPGQAEAYVISAFAKQVAEIMAGRRDPVIDVGNLDAERDFLDARDVVRAYAMAALDPVPDATDPVFNLASGRPRRIGSVLELLIEASKRPIDIRVDPGRLRPNDVPVAAGDATSIRRMLGWEPLISFEQTLIDVLNHWRAEL